MIYSTIEQFSRIAINTFDASIQFFDLSTGEFIIENLVFAVSGIERDTGLDRAYRIKVFIEFATVRRRNSLS